MNSEITFGLGFLAASGLFVAMLCMAARAKNKRRRSGFAGDQAAKLRTMAASQVTARTDAIHASHEWLFCQRNGWQFSPPPPTAEFRRSMLTCRWRETPESVRLNMIWHIMYEHWDRLSVLERQRAVKHYLANKLAFERHKEATCQQAI